MTIRRLTANDAKAYHALRLRILRETYLREVLTRLPTMTNRQIKDITPEALAKVQTASPQREAAEHSESKSNQL